MPKKCLHCRKELVRKVRANGLRESLADFEKRKTCDKVCARRFQASSLEDPPERTCPSCLKTMTRRVLEDGSKETLSSFLRRKYCDAQCAGNAPKEVVPEDLAFTIREVYKKGGISRPELMVKYSLTKVTVDKTLSGIRKGGRKPRIKKSKQQVLFALFMQTICVGKWDETTKNER